MSKYKCPECITDTHDIEEMIDGIWTRIIVCNTCGGRFRKEIILTVTKETNPSVSTTNGINWIKC